MTVSTRQYTAFEESRCIASGPLSEVAQQVKAVADQNRQKTILVFDDLSSELIELDLRGSSAELRQRLEAQLACETGAQAMAAAPDQATRGPGRPRLGVVAREVTLLPRHWQWLGSQPGGASVALRKLVEEARRSHEGQDRVRHAQEAAYRFMSAIAGHQAGFEEASRALFAGDALRFDSQTASWPPDVRRHARQLLAPAFDAQAGETA